MKKAVLFCALTVFSLNTASAEECYLELRGGVGAWKGPCKDGEAYGTGFATFPNGTYAGEAKDGRAHGPGKWRMEDGLYLEGEFRNGDVHGRHAGKDAQGNPIVGELQMGQDGKRQLIFLRDDRQADEKKPSQEAASGESRPEDAGEAKAAAGEAAASGAAGGGEPERQVESAAPGSSDSPVAATSPPGDAAATAPARAAPAARECRLEADGKFFDWSGQCKDGKAHGNGRATLSGGMTYTGSAEDGKLDGYGTVTSASGRMLYQGGYRDGAPHGRGTFLHDDDRYYVSDFDDGHEVGERILAQDFASGESPPENAGDTDTLAGGDALPGLDEDGDQEDEDGYEAAVNALDGGDGVVRAATPDDDYDAKLAELERREALEIEARFREKQLEAERRSEAIKAGIREEEAAKDAKKRRSRAPLDRKVKKYWERELGSSGTKRSRGRTSSDNFGGFGKALERLHKTIKEREKLERQLERNRQALRKKRKARKRERELEQKRKLEQLRRKELEWERTVERLRQEEYARQRRAEQQRREQLERQRREQQKERERRERLARLARERDRKIASLRKALNRALARCNRLKHGRSGCRNGQIRFYNGEIRNARRNYEILSR